jgi:REP-associated tyrosine transposase
MQNRQKCFGAMTAINFSPGETYFAVVREKTLGTGFFDDACKEFYLRRLLACQKTFHVILHAYLLMEREILLLFTPLTPKGASSYIRFLNRSYSEYYRIRFARSILAWQDAALTSCVPNGELILDCQKFLERYILKSDSISHPGEYRYSSYCENAFVLRPSSVMRHRGFREFIDIESNGLRAYRDFVASPFQEEYEKFLQSRLLRGRPLLL